jgi:hypothetical protein
VSERARQRAIYPCPVLIPPPCNTPPLPNGAPLLRHPQARTERQKREREQSSE